MSGWWILAAVLAAGEPEVMERAVPEAVHMRPPSFPADLVPRTQDVTRMVRVVVGPDGTVTDAQMVEPGGALEDAAILKAAMTWVFKPAIHQGVPIAATVDVPVHIETHFPTESVQTTPGQVPPMTTIVRDQAGPPPAAAAGDLHIEVGRLSKVPRTSAAKLLTLAPAVMLSNHGGEGHAPQLFVRGFDAGEGKDVEVMLEGVPLNDVSNAHGHGYVDSYFIIPELVQSLRVTEGNLHAAQGDFAVAGSVDFNLGVPTRGLTLKAEYGAYNEQRILALWGPEYAPAGTFAAVQFKQGSGYGPARAFSHGSMMAQWELKPSESVRLKVLGAVSAGRFSSAGVIRADDLKLGQLPCGASERAQFFCTYDADQGGAQQRHLLTAELDHKLGSGRMNHVAFGVFRQMRVRENFTGFLNDLPPAGQSQRGDNAEMGYGGATVGMRGSFRPAPAHAWTTELGYLFRYDDVNSFSRRRRAEGGAPYRVLFDNDVRVSNLAAYGQGEWSPSEHFKLRLGLRIDSFLFAVVDKNRPVLDRQGERLGTDHVEAHGFLPSPRVSVEHRWTPQLSWLTGLGMGARSSDAAALSDAEFAPFARALSGETGLKWETGPKSLRLELRGAAFYTHVSEDLVFDETAGRNMPLGPSRRLGAFAYGRVRGENLELQGHLAYAYANWVPGDGSPWQFKSGPAMPYVPRALGRLDAAGWRSFQLAGQELTASAGLGLSYLGPRPLPLDVYADPVWLIDASAQLRWKQFELGLAAENLLDTLWREAEFNYASNFRGPDQPRPDSPPATFRPEIHG